MATPKFLEFANALGNLLGLRTVSSQGTILTINNFHFTKRLLQNLNFATQMLSIIGYLLSGKRAPVIHKQFSSTNKFTTLIFTGHNFSTRKKSILGILVFLNA